jgi:hypothetical protein
MDVDIGCATWTRGVGEGVGVVDGTRWGGCEGVFAGRRWEEITVAEG